MVARCHWLRGAIGCVVSTVARQMEKLYDMLLTDRRALVQVPLLLLEYPFTYLPLTGRRALVQV